MALFKTTRWTLIMRAQSASAEVRADALGELCRAYWRPIFAVIRHSTRDTDTASDLTQGFFLKKVLEQDLLQHVDRSCGRFRTFLIVVVKRYLADERDHAGTIKQGGKVEFVSLDMAGAEDGYAAAVRDGDTPERTFQRAWALTILGRAMDRLRAKEAAAGRAEQFEVLRPLLPAGSSPQYPEAAIRLRKSVGAVKVAVHRLRRPLYRLLKEEVAETVLNEAEVEDELRQLLQALTR